MNTKPLKYNSLNQTIIYNLYKELKSGVFKEKFLYLESQGVLYKLSLNPPVRISQKTLNNAVGDNNDITYIYGYSFEVISTSIY